ncbi:MAG: glucose-6-phosphate isomerase, partial [Candidatus Thermoplasmatota archaeon]|nr:glucose-6-phosphate isomerase [Candidatus Thermoplasmatota archaeon]
LKMANLVARDFSSLYQPLQEKQGAAYFELTNGWVKNQAYKRVPELRIQSPCQLFSPDLYCQFQADPEKFAFLTAPQDYLGFFEELKIRETL